ncbi:sensor domain-containing phosphodiesterase [Oleispirillum naphthae]|uniref:putative bifunctional diguanylate cyclase/phosphodiesterase n=1 Tax=Oleispirillum naphthae TaxID=2838853 RepID=UPI00308221BB
MGETAGHRHAASRFGISAKLWLAFGAVAAMTVLASFVALRTFDIAGGAIDKIAQRRLPVMVALTRMTQQGNLLLATVPSLIYAPSLEALQTNERNVAAAEEAFITAQAEAHKALATVSGTGIDAVGELSSRIGAHLQILQSAMEHRWMLMEQQQALGERLQNSALAHKQPALAGISGHIPHAPLQHLPMLTEGIPNIVPEGSPEAADLHRMIALRRGEISMLTMATSQLDHIRRLGGMLDAETGRLIESWQSSGADDRTEVIASLKNGRSILLVTSGTAVLAALGIAWFYVGRRVTRRISALTASMLTIADGDYDARIPEGGNDEVTRMASALAVFRDAMRRLALLARCDPLTGLLNRNGLAERGDALLAAGGAGALIYLNLAAFKDINDTFGHDTGDRILVEVANRLRAVAGEAWMLARLGGDDFAALIPGCDAAAAEAQALRIQAALAQPPDDSPVPDLRAAIGIALYPRYGAVTAALLQHADMAMNVARTAAEASLRFYEPALGTAALHRKAIRAELRKGLDEGQFRLVYQPKVEIASGRVVGVESLLRWTHPEKGAIPPADFIPVAERSGFIQALGAWVLAESCRQARLWRDEGIALSMAVNFSASQFLRADVVAEVERVLAETGLPPQHLEIEITESVFLRGEAEVLQRLRELRAFGIGLALDDFGTGYSSLSYLKRLPVSCLKIDQSFVRDMFSSATDTRITAEIIRMAHELGLTVVAEGIEEDRQFAFFRDAGCDIGQGFLFARPMEAQSLAPFLAARGAAGAPRCGA